MMLKIFLFLVLLLSTNVSLRVYANDLPLEPKDVKFRRVQFQLKHAGHQYTYERDSEGNYIEGNLKTEWAREEARVQSNNRAMAANIKKVIAKLPPPEPQTKIDKPTQVVSKSCGMPGHEACPTPADQILSPLGNDQVMKPEAIKTGCGLTGHDECPTITLKLPPGAYSKSCGLPGYESCPTTQSKLPPKSQWVDKSCGMPGHEPCPTDQEKQTVSIQTRSIKIVSVPPAVQPPAVQPPAVQPPAAQQPAAQQPAAQQPAAQQPAAQQPAAQPPAAQPPAVQVKEKKTKCDPKEQRQFRDLYLALQKELDYEGKKITYDKKTGKAKSSKSPASPIDETNGKKFEKRVNKEFQNSLKKVAALFQKTNTDSPLKPNSSLIEFIKSIDPSSTASATKDINYENFFKALEDKSKTKFTDNPSYILNAQDMYLLQKLMIHAKDRICSVGYLNDGKSSKVFSKEHLEEAKASPINILLETYNKVASTGSGAKIPDLKDEGEVINQATKEVLKNLKKLFADNPACQDIFKSKAYANSIQDNIQPCNYNKFLSSLSDASSNDVESILHFINANEQLINEKGSGYLTIKPVASTGISQQSLKDAIKETLDSIQGVENPPTTPMSEEDKCKADPKKEWKGGACVDKAPQSEEDKCKADPKKEWKGGACVDKAPQSEEDKCKADPKKEWKGGACVDKAPQSEEDKCKADPNKEWKAGACVEKTADPKADCEKKNLSTEEGATPINSHKFSYNEKTKSCDEKKTDEKAASEPDAPEEEPVARPEAKGMPTRAPDIQAPPRPGLGVSQGLQ